MPRVHFSIGVHFKNVSSEYSSKSEEDCNEFEDVTNFSSLCSRKGICSKNSKRSIRRDLLWTMEMCTSTTKRKMGLYGMYLCVQKTGRSSVFRLLIVLLGYMYTILLLCNVQVRYIINRQEQIVIACHEDFASGHMGTKTENPSKNYRTIYMARCYKGCSRISKFSLK